MDACAFAAEILINSPVGALPGELGEAFGYSYFSYILCICAQMLRPYIFYDIAYLLILLLELCSSSFQLSGFSMMYRLIF